MYDREIARLKEEVEHLDWLSRNICENRYLMKSICLIEERINQLKLLLLDKCSCED